MDEKRYLKIGIMLVMFITIIVTAYALHINAASSRHIALMAETDYLAVVGEKTSYIDVYPEIKNVNIYAEPKWMIDVQAQVEGVISEIYVNSGDFVKKGQVIAKIENIDLPAQLAQTESLIFQSSAKFLESEKNISRYEKLIASGGVSLQQYDNALSARDMALGELNSTRAQKEQLLVKASKTIVTAPADSEVINVYRGKGYYINSGEAVILLGDLSEFTVKLNFSADELEKLMPLDRLATLSIREQLLRYKVYPTPFKTSSTADRENHTEIIMELVQIDPPLEVGSQYRSVTWQIKESGGMVEPTTYQNSSIKFKTPRRILAVPLNALFYDETTACLYVISKENRLELREVKTGVQSGTHVEILDGIKEGESVVVSTKQGLHPNLKVKVVPLAKHNF